MVMFKGKGPDRSQGAALWLAISMMLLLVYHVFDNSPSKTQPLVFSEFINKVESNQISSVVISGEIVTAKGTDGNFYATYIPRFYGKLLDDLQAKNVSIEIRPTDTVINNFLNILLSWLPMLLFIGVWFYFMRSVHGGGKAMGFGRSRARMVNEGNNKIDFSGVAGVDEAKEELMEIVEFLRNPAKFERLGGKIPRGCLLVGYPGTGKTLLARAVAGEADVPFFSISGSDFVEMFVGVGASRVRDMFEQAKKSAPCIVFIDEIDAVGRHRGAGLGGGNDEREQTLNQMLVEMDGFSDNQGVIIIAATNRPDVLDPALLRPGRFDRRITVPMPDIKGREQILLVHTKKIPLASEVELKVLARCTPGFAGADLKNMVNEAALWAARHNRNLVTTADFDYARDKVTMGPERKSLSMKQEEKELTAYHEGGHALVAIHSVGADPVHKATIVPRGLALGMVMQLPEDDKFSMTYEQYMSRVTVCMGGRVAEEIIFGANKVTSGAASDIKQATSLARKMVTQFGFSKEIGPVLVGDEQEEVFLGHSLAHQRMVSENVIAKVDAEVRRIIEECYASAKKIIEDNLDKLHLLAKCLLEHETLTGEEINALLAGEDIKVLKQKKREELDAEMEIAKTSKKRKLKRRDAEQ